MIKANLLDIKSDIDINTAKKIIGNTDNAKLYLLNLVKIKNFDLDIHILKSGANKGCQQLKYSTQETFNIVVKTWEYKKSIKIIRNLFTNTKKYEFGINAEKELLKLKKEWNNLKLGPIEWPCSQGSFDPFVQSINSRDISTNNKDKIIKKAAMQYRRIKELNTLRNDFIETLIFNKNLNIIPTLRHSRGVDFFINGISYDQKVAKSPTQSFKDEYGDDWINQAIKNPEVVASYLYEHQDEGRFGYSPRLFVVYLNEDIEPSDIKNIINKINMKKPLDIKFKYEHENSGTKNYETKAYVVLLYK